MRKFVILLFLFVVISYWHGANAQTEVTQQQAINTVLDTGIFSYALDARPNWRASAYNAHNRYGIWRVQFWDAQGEVIGWADINPISKRIFDYQSFYTSLDLQEAIIEPIIRDFLNANSEVLALIGPINPQHPLDLVYQSDKGLWDVSIHLDVDTIGFTVKFNGASPVIPENPELVRIFFPTLLPYDEWYKNNKEQASLIALRKPEIANALREHHWEAIATLLDDGLSTTWLVNFLVDDEVVAAATVNVFTHEILTYSIFAQ